MTPDNNKEVFELTPEEAEWLKKYPANYAILQRKIREGTARIKQIQHL